MIAGAAGQRSLGEPSATRSARRLQPGEGDIYEAANGGPGRELPRRVESVQAVAGELARCNVVSDVSGRDAVAHQVADEVSEVILSFGDMPAPVHEGGKLGVVVFVVDALVLDDRVGGEHGFEAFARVAGSVAEHRELLEVAFDLLRVPGQQDRLDVWEVLVERRAADAGLLSDLRHRHRTQSMVCDERRGGPEDGLPY